MKIKNWEKWQTYRQDRGAPPWIKVHRNLMSNSDWVSLSDAEKGQLISMWIVAADKGGHLPEDPVMIRKMCLLDGTPNINKFKRLGFIDAKRMPRRRQPDAPETETETEEEKHKLPEWIEKVAWNDFSDMRRKIRSPMTERAEQLLIGKLDKFREQGHNANDILNQSTMNCWKSVYEIKGNSTGKPNVKTDTHGRTPHC